MYVFVSLLQAGNVGKVEGLSTYQIHRLPSFNAALQLKDISTTFMAITTYIECIYHKTSNKVPGAYLQK